MPDTCLAPLKSMLQTQASLRETLQTNTDGGSLAPVPQLLLRPYDRLQKPFNTVSKPQDREYTSIENSTREDDLPV